MNRRLTKTNASEQKSKDGCTQGRRIFLRARTSGTETLDALETFESLRRTFISSFRIHNGRSLGGQWYARCKEIIWNIGGRLLQSGKQRYSTGVERTVRSCAWRDRAHKMQSWFNVIFCSKRCIDRNSSARVDLHQRDIVHDSLTRSLCRSEIVSVIPCNFLVTITNISSSSSDFYQGNVLNLAEILSTTVFFFPLPLLVLYSGGGFDKTLWTQFRAARGKKKREKKRGRHRRCLFFIFHRYSSFYQADIFSTVMTRLCKTWQILYLYFAPSAFSRADDELFNDRKRCPFSSS